MKISVIICTHNPNLTYLNKVLQSLKEQSLGIAFWELIVVDNKSSFSVKDTIDIRWHSNAKVLIEEQLGLIHARMCGVKHAHNEIIVTVDDDTPLQYQYLANVLEIYQSNSNLGIIGGKTIPQFEVQPPDWLPQFYSLLAIRNLGDQSITANLNQEDFKHYPECAPLLIAPLKTCMLQYWEHYNNDSLSKELGRKGNQLASGEDNDINLFIYRQGYTLGYFPQLEFTHIIPAHRMEKEYLGRLNYNSSKTWVKVLNKYKISPWSPVASWTVPLRKLKAWFAHAAWKTPANYIKWRGACGMFKGLSEL